MRTKMLGIYRRGGARTESPADVCACVWKKMAGLGDGDALALLLHCQRRAFVAGFFFFFHPCLFFSL